MSGNKHPLIKHKKGQTDRRTPPTAASQPLTRSVKPAFHYTDTDTDTATTRPTRLHPYVRHVPFPRKDPREDVGVGVVECGLN